MTKEHSKGVAKILKGTLAGKKKIQVLWIMKKVSIVLTSFLRFRSARVKVRTRVSIRVKVRVKTTNILMHLNTCLIHVNTR